ncbi:MAG: hypothetical protein J6B44_06485, partial [Muribaculaceae bacterium]|nr:hypothetical protein [Muribaculaceae bacterium]
MEVSVIIAILIIFGVVRAINIYRNRLGHKGQRLSVMVKKAMSEFDAISNYGKLASEKEIHEYKAKYAELSEEIRKFRFSKMMTQKLFDSFGIGDYTVFYETIDKHYRE